MRSKRTSLVVLAIAATFFIGYTNAEICQNNNGIKANGNDFDYRLPKTISPTSYDIILVPPLNGQGTTFTGTIKINASVNVATEEIVFNAGNISIDKVVVTSDDASASVLTVIKTTHDLVTEKCTIQLREKLPEGKSIRMTILYRGTLRDDMIGFYKSSYIDNNGKTKWLFATQFQATHARHAFPCFDEPSFKASFIIRILRTQKLFSLSNMPLYEVKLLPNGLAWDTFNESIPMSTYLVAFVISDFTALEEGNFKVWSRQNAIEQAKYALKVGPQALRLLSNLFDQDYQLDKMDMVAVPDFAAGAMENWGLITYRETRMLYDVEHSSVSAQQDVASVIVHECAHMWFGNLVTPKWWSYLWLSEGFARYYQYIATGKLEPNWKMEQQFVVEQLQTVFATDALPSSNPMSRNHIYSPADIGTTGDTITYAKGGSIVRMMELTFGSIVFNAGLQEYLRVNQYASTSPEDLFVALQHQVDAKGLKLGASVETIMNTWTRQPGFPVLSVDISNGVATLRQQRFLLRSLKASVTNTTWWIPITWTTSKNPNFLSTTPKYWLSNEIDKIDIKMGNDDWIVFNIQESGFYRVNYDKDSWYRIIAILTSDDFEKIHEVNRAAIVDDLLNLARAGLLAYDTALTGLNYIRRETNYLPFKAALNGLEYLHKRFAGQENYNYIRNHSLALIEIVYINLGYDDRAIDDRLTILLRKELNSWACYLDEPECIAKSKEYFSNWRLNTKPVPKNLRPAVYCTAIKYGTATDWDFLWEKYLKSNCASEQLVILKALGCTQDKTIIEKYLLNAIKNFEESRIRRQDSTAVFSAVYGSGIFSAEYILDFVSNHHLAMSKYYGGYDTVANILSGASQRFSTKNLVDKYEEFITKHKTEFSTILKSLEASLELAKYELRWFEENEDDIIAWMKKNNKDEETTTTTSLPPTTDKPTDPDDTTNYRLPTSIVPMNYVIKLTPYIEPGNFTFDGIVQITARIVESTNKVVLHVNELVYHSITLTVDGKHLEILSKTENEQYNFLTIILATSLSIGTTVNIEITYTGNLNANMRGFYRSSYIDNAGNTKWLAATHLEPVGARQMFPCFDEPAMKSTFQISVNRPAKYGAISNTPLKSSAPITDGRVWDTFEQTPVMSTYLVALVVSDFKSLNDVKNNCSTWARPNAVHETKYALSIMAPLIRFYEKVVGHPYQLPKLDMVALPDFVSGAMENWGLLTFRETNMLYDENYSTIATKQAIANVISHEISHQWFGNLVSPSWWKYLWLSEGFARYFQYHGTANVETKWGLESQFLVEQLQNVLVIDSFPSTRPMTHDVYKPTEISAIFDSISYAKAASILRMVQKIFGSTLFYNALHDYLQARNYSDATPEHLFEAFQNQVSSTGVELEASVKTILDSWTTQAGYPVVHVTIADGKADLRQEQFLLKNPNKTSIDKIWWVPITWASNSNPDFKSTSPKYWLSEKIGSIELNDSNDWVIFNVQQSGYYRVNYDVASWNRIINFLKSKDFAKIHEINRASIIDDLLNFGRNGYVDFRIVLSASQYLRNETNYIPWRAAFNGLVYLNVRIDGTEINDLYKTHILTILSSIYEQLGFEETANESHYDTLLRRHVVAWACQYDFESCVSKSLQHFANWKQKPSSLVPVNLRTTIYCTAIKHGTEDDWEFLWKQYLTTNVDVEKTTILKGLGCSNNTKVLHKFLMSAITKDSGIQVRVSTDAFASVVNSGIFGAEYALDFVDQYYAQMYEYYGKYDSIRSIINVIVSRFSTRELVLKFEKFVEKHNSSLAPIKIPLENYLTRAREELIWYDTHSPKIFEWLDETYPSRDYRLPTKIYPISYEIYLTPYLDESNFTFDGEVKIDMEVLQDTTSIVLHANELKINKIIVYINSAEQPITVSSYSINRKTHKFSIYLTTKINAGTKLSTYIKYSGILNDKMQGFYRSSYIDSDGNTRWLATTQFEPVYTRQAFPCFDEPSFKAKFSIHIERPNDYHTLSNMPLSVSIPSDKANRTWDSYEESKIMASYLVAFVVSDFKSLKNKDGNFSVWVRPDAIQHSSYALTVGQEVLSFLENFTGIGYPIRKMDMVAIPDFSAGAMENWGLITFREYGLLYHENVTSVSFKKYLNTVVAHELVHMWFGNLVTCDWWDYLWLNEGFAEYFQWIAGNFTEPDWNLLDQFVVYELQKAMQIDASPMIHPMNNKVANPWEIARSFDTIEYAKSASVIRMMHHAFGRNVFESALRSYLNAHKYDNAKPEDLWASIEIHIKDKNSIGNLKASVSSLMDSWASQPGYPVINASWTSDVLSLKQQRFVFANLATPATQLDSVFWIPITFTTKSEANFKDTELSFWFGTSSSKMPLVLKDNEWFILNVQEIGYYRVNYDKESWNRLLAALETENFDGIPEVNRAQIIDDLLNLARADYVSYDIALRATKYLSREDNHIPWKAFFNNILFLSDRFSGHEIGEDFAEFVVELMQRIYEKIGFVDNKDASHLEQLNQQMILTWACKLGHSGCMEMSQQLFREWRKDETKWISPNFRPAVYCTALKIGNYEDWEFLWRQYEKTDSSSEKVVILDALGCTKNKTTLINYLKRAISSDTAIRDQDTNTALSSVYNADKFGVNVALEFLIENYIDVYKYFKDWRKVATLFWNVAVKMSTQDQITKFESFLNDSVAVESGLIEVPMRNAIHVANAHLKWFNSHSEDIHLWLTKVSEVTESGGNEVSEVPNGSCVMSCNVLLMFGAFYLVIMYYQ